MHIKNVAVGATLLWNDVATVGIPAFARHLWDRGCNVAYRAKAVSRSYLNWHVHSLARHITQEGIAAPDASPVRHTTSDHIPWKTRLAEFDAMLASEGE